MNFKLTTEERIKRQVISLTNEQPFWAYLILKLRIKEAKKGELPEYAGAGVNARGEMFYKKDWMEECTDEEIKFVLAHEVGHLVWGHLLRIGSRHPVAWNIAADAVLNGILKENGFKILRSSKERPLHNCICPDSDDSIKIFGTQIDKVSSYNAEQLYDMMPQMPQMTISISGDGDGDGGDQGDGSGKQPAGEGGADGKGNFGFDAHIKTEGMGEAERQKLEGEWKNAVTEAATHAKMRGHLPAGMEKLIGDILDPKLNWKQIIMKYVKSVLPFDSSFSRPNKKFLSNGIILPGTIKETIDIICHIDVSGSISDDELRSFLGEMKGITQAHRNVHVTIIQADMEINDVSSINTRSVSELTSFKRKGYGGTSHKPVFEYIEKNHRDCKLLISFTDGYSDIDEIQRPKYDVIWGLTRDATDSQITWGKKVWVK